MHLLRPIQQLGKGQIEQRFELFERPACVGGRRLSLVAVKLDRCCLCHLRICLVRNEWLVCDRPFSHISSSSLACCACSASNSASQRGLRFSRKARIPSFASSDARTTAIRSAVSSSSASSTGRPP